MQCVVIFRCHRRDLTKWDYNLTTIQVFVFYLTLGFFYIFGHLPEILIR